MNEFLMIDRTYFREMARQVKLAHNRPDAPPCPCQFCAHGQRMGIPVEELPAA